MTEVINTGERILLEKETPLMIARHLSAYKFAQDYCRNRQVLDLGCGEGYGTYDLAGFAQTATGIDYDPAIIDYARQKYRKANLQFFPGTAEEAGFLKMSFDVICSFQVVEHIENPRLYLESICGLLAAGGIFICSTPNRLDASPQSAVPLNKFHRREYLYEEFKSLLAPYFRKIDIFGLKRSRKLNFYRRMKKIGVFNLLPPAINPVHKFFSRRDCANFVITKDSPQAALDFIAVCQK